MILACFQVEDFLAEFKKGMITDLEKRLFQFAEKTFVQEQMQEQMHNMRIKLDEVKIN